MSITAKNKSIEVATNGAFDKMEQIMPYAFPFLPKNTRGLITLAFWHSILLTATTPIFRALGKRWRGELSLYALVSYFAPSWVTESLTDYRVIYPGLEYPAEGKVVAGAGPTIGIDRAFALHAGCGLLWLIAAYIQMCHTTKNPKLHKYFGYFSSFAFAGHVCAAVNCVYTDVVRHTAIPKIILLFSIFDIVVYLAIAIGFAKRKTHGWLQQHSDWMVKCFFTSINGAGPIRMIAQAQTWFNCGPMLCQNQYGGMATQCQVQYVNRLMLIGLLTQYFFGMYVMIRKDSKFTRRYVREAARLICLSFLIFAFGYLPHAEWILHRVFGEPRSLQATVALFVALGYKILSGIGEYRAELPRITDQHKHQALLQTKKFAVHAQSRVSEDFRPIRKPVVSRSA